MRAAVTAIAGLRGALACEYEIRSDAGTVLAFDFVVIHPHEDEVWADIEGLLLSWLSRRAVRWLENPAGRRESERGGHRLMDITREPPPIVPVGSLPSVQVRPGQ